MANNDNKKVIFKNWVPFTDCICEINSTQVDNVKGIDLVMLMYNYIEYSDNYLETSGSLWQYYREKPAVNGNSNTVGFNAANVTDSFNFTVKITGQTDNNGNFWNVTYQLWN